MTHSTQSSPTICIIAGESSGDNLGAGLIEGIRTAVPEAQIIGIGGPAMEERGFTSLFPMSELSVMGIAEILPRLPSLLSRIRETAAFIQQARPDVVVTIDSPDFSFRVANKLQGAGIPLVHYVAPTVWAWRAKRARKIAGLYDHLLALFPFEPNYFEREGLPTTFVGHPVVTAGMDGGDAEHFRATQSIGPDTPVLCLLPGSRNSELSRLLPVFLDTLEQLRARIPDLHAVFPTVPHLEDTVRNALHNIRNVAIVTDEGGKIDAYAASNAALAASGTVALELALAGVPAVIGYKLNAMSAFLARRMLYLDRYSLPNILLERDVMPELIQEDCVTSKLCQHVYPLLVEKDARVQQLSAFEEVRKKLTPDDGAPNDIAAAAVLSVCQKKSA